MTVYEKKWGNPALSIVFNDRTSIERWEFSLDKDNKLIKERLKVLVYPNPRIHRLK